MIESRGDVELTLRRTLLGLAALTCLFSVVELGLMEHYASWTQRIPFLLAVLIWGAAATGISRGRGAPVRVIRSLAVVVFAGACLGIYQHVSSNYEFAMEIRPSQSIWTGLWQACRGGSPLLAPGAFALAAMMCWASTLKEQSSYRRLR